VTEQNRHGAVEYWDQQISFQFTQVINAYFSISQQPYLVNANDDYNIVDIVIGNATDPAFT
jgi:hypothetical protein